MEAKRPRFPLYVHAYLWMFFAIVCLIPLGFGEVAADGGSIAMKYMTSTLTWFILVAASFWYAQVRCSSEHLHFQDGLLWVTASMMTGWTYMSFATVFPALAVAFFGSVLTAMMGQMRRDKNWAQDRFVKLVRFFYRNRMRR